jgi:hypothetical protein
MLVGTLLLGSLAAADANAAPRLDPKRMERLAKGEIIIFSFDDPKEGVRGKAIGIVDAPPEQLFGVLRDYEAYREFVPQVRRSQRVRSLGAMQDLVLVETSLPWPIRNAWSVSRFVAKQQKGPVFEIRWRMVQGNMRSNSGYVYLEPWGPGGRQTAVTYEMGANPTRLASDTVLHRGMRLATRGMLRALRKRVEALRIAGRLAPKVQPTRGAAPGRNHAGHRRANGG